MQLDVGRQIDRYTLEAPIGAGGQGFVYRVRHIQLGTDHALKVVTGAGPRVRERLLLEGRAQARLRHPNIVTVTDVLEVDGDPGLIMEFISGPPLSHLLSENALTIEQADLLVSGILDGVAHAHGLRFIHRDLKPDNILCAVTPRGLVPKIMDFGLVKTLDGGTGNTGVRATRSGAMMGTAHYMSPEQIRSTKHVDERSDIWSLGVIFYEMLTGTVPFDGADTFEIFASATTGIYRPLAELRPELPERMIKAVEAALVINADERVASVDELRALWLGVSTSLTATPDGGRQDSGAWDPTMLDKYKTTSLAISEASGSMNTWLEPAGNAKTSGHTLTPGMGMGIDSPSRSSKMPWLVLALGATLGVIGLLSLAFIAVNWPTPESTEIAAPPEVSKPEPEPVEAVVEPTEPTPEPSSSAEPTRNPGAAPKPPKPTSKPSPEPAPKPKPKPKPDPEPVVAPAPVVAAPRPRPAATTLGTFVLAGHASGDSAYLAPTDGGRYIRPGGTVPAGEYKLFFTVGGTTLPMATKSVQAGQGLKATCLSASQACHLTVVAP